MCKMRKARIAYAGPALEDGTMDVRELAPALISKEDYVHETEEQTMLAHIISLNFEQGKWRLSDGTNAFWASIVDEGFLEKMERGDVSFTKGDMLLIEYHLKQTVKAGKLTTEYVVSKVLEQKKAPRQIKLDFEENT